MPARRPTPVTTATRPAMAPGGCTRSTVTSRPMPEYLAPGVFVDEVPSAVKSIEGVSTSTVGFVGTTAIGPTNAPVLVRSFTEFEEIYGRGCDLAHAAQAFFAQDGRRLFVQRVTGPED